MHRHYELPVSGIRHGQRLNGRTQREAIPEWGQADRGAKSARPHPPPKPPRPIPRPVPLPTPQPFPGTPPLPSPI